MVRKTIFGIVFLLCISFVFAVSVSESGYIGNYQQKLWDSNQPTENLTFIGGDNQTVYVSIPKYSNVIYSQVDISSADNLVNLSIEVGTADDNLEFQNSYDSYIGDSAENIYYIVVEADSSTAVNDGNINISELSNNKWLVWRKADSYEVNRAKVIHWLYRPILNTNSYSAKIFQNFTNVTSLGTIDSRDTKRVSYYGKSINNRQEDYYKTDTGTFQDTTNNINASIWSSMGASCVVGANNQITNQIRMPAGFVQNGVGLSCDACSTSANEYDIDTSAQHQDNPATIEIEADMDFHSPGAFSASWDMLILHEGEINWNFQMGNNVSDYTSNYSLPEMTLDDGTSFGFNSTDEITGFEDEMNNYLVNCTGDVDGYCQIPFNAYSDSSGSLELDISNSINYSLLYNFTYDNSVFENDETTYSLKVYSNYPLQVDSTFYFNNTPYSPTSFSYDTGYKQMDYTMAVVPFVGDGIVFTSPLYWNVDDDGNISNTSTYNQTVNRLNLAKCTDQPNWTKVINIYSLDEEGNSTNYVNTNLNFNANIWYDNENELQNFSFQFQGDSNYSICIFPNSTGYVNAIMEYYSDDYANRKYYLDNYSIDSNASRDLYLYNLNSSKSSDITLYVYDRNTGKAVNGAYVKILRYYPETNEYRTVEIEKTDANGYSLGKMVLADVFYKFVVEYDRIVVYNGAVERIISLTKQIPVLISGDLLESWRSIDDISSSVTCTEVTKTCRFTWSDSSNLVQTVTMKVYRVNGYGKTAISEQSSSAVSGSLLYTISENTTGNEYIAVGYIHTNTANSFYTMGEDFIEYRESMSDQFGAGGLLPMFLLLIVMGAVLLDTGAVGVVVGSLIAIVGGTLIGIIPFGVTTIISFIIMGAILIGKLKS